MFFKTTLTVPKIKDLVNSPNQKYQNIYDTISHKFDSNINNYTNSNVNSNSYTSIDLLPIPSEQNSMKDELKSFLKKQLNNDTANENIMTIDSLTANNFSSY